MANINVLYVDEGKYYRRHMEVSEVNDKVVSMINKSMAERLGYKISDHLCSTCKKLLECRKVMDSEKHLITGYPFITAGLNVYDPSFIPADKIIYVDGVAPNGYDAKANSKKMHSCIVLKCDNYKRG